MKKIRVEATKNDGTQWISSPSPACRPVSSSPHCDARSNAQAPRAAKATTAIFAEGVERAEIHEDDVDHVAPESLGVTRLREIFRDHGVERHRRDPQHAGEDGEREDARQHRVEAALATAACGTEYERQAQQKLR